MEKRERAQKMKRDKRKKDVHRAHDHPNKSENKSNSAALSKPSIIDKQGDVNPALNEENDVEEAKEQQPQINFANLKRETDEIKQLNTKTYSKRQIASNWAKYETPLPPEDDEVISKGADFESLLSAPISEGGHFKFKSEQMWSQNPLHFSDIFSLDVKHLAKSLSCIPFYKQVSIPKELFSQEEAEIMDKEAAQNSESYKNSPEVPTVDNFYEVLKSSLVESCLKNSSYNKSDVTPTSVAKESTQTASTKTMFSFTDHQMNDTQPVTSVHHQEKGVDSSRETQEIIFRPKNEKQEIVVDKSNMFPEIGSSPSERSLDSELDVPVENKNLCTMEEVSTKGNNVTKSCRTDIPVSATVPSECNSQTNETILSQNAKQDDADDDLDFLLTLKQPISGPKFDAKNPPKPVTTNDILSDDLGALSLSSTTETKAELEDWLDSMLAD